MTETARDWVLRKRGYFYRPNAQGYTASIHEAGRYTEAEAKAHAAEGVSPPVTAHPASEFIKDAIPATKKIIDYIARYGGACRDCGDEDGICPASGLPCGGAAKAIRHVLKAYNYGVAHGFIEPPATR